MSPGTIDDMLMWLNLYCAAVMALSESRVQDDGLVGLLNSKVILLFDVGVRLTQLSISH